MKEVGLKYKGNTLPLHLEQPWLKKKITFVNNTEVVWVIKSDVDKLLQFNPRMFEIMGERAVKGSKVDPVPKVEPKVDDSEEVPVTFVKEPTTAPPEKPEQKKRGMPKGGWPKKNQKKENTDGDRKAGGVLG